MEPLVVMLETVQETTVELVDPLVRLLTTVMYQAHLVDRLLEMEQQEVMVQGDLVVAVELHRLHSQLVKVVLDQLMVVMEEQEKLNLDI
jgi:hypothetical protein